MLVRQEQQQQQQQQEEQEQEQEQDLSILSIPTYPISPVPSRFLTLKTPIFCCDAPDLSGSQEKLNAGADDDLHIHVTLERTLRTLATEWAWATGKINALEI